MAPYSNINPTGWNSTTGGNLFDNEAAPSVKRGSVSVNAEIQNISHILYRVPSERVRNLVPRPLVIETTEHARGRDAWLSVVSFLDLGFQSEGHRSFEQTNYRLHVMRNGQPGHWLLGISLGSLSGVGARNLWAMPWHLSAMEFQVSYDKSMGRYTDYRLQTQSQWANSSWEIIDGGQSLLFDQAPSRELPSSPAARSIDHYYHRRDGSIGLYQTRHGNQVFTAAKLRHAQSDLIERLGLLTRDELLRPELAGVQHQTTCQIFSPAILGEKFAPPREIGLNQRSLAYAS